MANLPTRILRMLNERRHAHLECDIQEVFPAFRIKDIDRAVQQLKTAKLIAWTVCGWLITEPGIIMATGGNRLHFEMPNRAQSGRTTCPPIPGVCTINRMTR